MSAQPDPTDPTSWDPKSQEEFMRRLNAERSAKRQYWYCNVGRTCDGKPHEGFDYKHARGDQWPPEGNEWEVWLLSGGRGSGKTRSGSEWVRKSTERIARFGILGPTVAHVRDVMVEGDSGILSVCERARVRAKWEPSKRRITLPNDHVIHTYSGEEPELLRGRQHGGFWLDEPAHVPLIQAVWDNMLLGLRQGLNPKVLCSTTPLPIPWLVALIEDPGTVTVRVSTYVNLDNLAKTFRKAVLARYEGTRLGQQELHGELLLDVEGAMWSWDMIEDNRVSAADFPWDAMQRIVIGIDPSGTDNKKRDEAGVVAVGFLDNHYYVLGDASGTYSPEGWARQAYSLYDEYQADKIVAEKNYGGQMVLSTLKNFRRNQGHVEFGEAKLVNSRRGKELRAEPVVALYEQNRVHHVGTWEKLETQMTTWVPGHGSSPDRVDALVHAMTELGGGSMGEVGLSAPKGFLVPPPALVQTPWLNS